MQTEIFVPTWQAAMMIHSTAIMETEDLKVIFNAQQEIIRCGALLDEMQVKYKSLQDRYHQATDREDMGR